MSNVAVVFIEWLARQQFALLCSAFLLLAMAGGTVGSMQTRAIFTAQTVNTAELSTGTLALTLGTTNALVTFDQMFPGDAVAAPISVANTGTLDLRYAISSVATNQDGKKLGGQLELTIKTLVTQCDAAHADLSGTELYRGAAASVADGTTANPLVGSSAAGVQAGDRTLASSATETLCFRVRLPETTPNAFQSSATTLAFVFDAEQSSNNP